MLDISSYPLALQLLMQTDGTVTDLIQLLTKEQLNVIKLHEDVNHKTSLLKRKIYLQGKDSKINWLSAESKINLSNLPYQFVEDLMHHNLPIGALWTKYQVETYKVITDKKEVVSTNSILSGYEVGEKLLSRTYKVFSNQKLIMEITERFPISRFINLELFSS